MQVSEEKKLSLTWGVGESCTILFIASLDNQPMYPKMCSIDIFVNLQLVG